MKFTYEAYESLIKNIIDSGYGITDYHNFKRERHPCVLRHDVDMDLEKAADFAEFEKNLGGG